MFCPRKDFVLQIKVGALLLPSDRALALCPFHRSIGWFSILFSPNSSWTSMGRVPQGRPTAAAAVLRKLNQESKNSTRAIKPKCGRRSPHSSSSGSFIIFLCAGQPSGSGTNSPPPSLDLGNFCLLCIFFNFPILSMNPFPMHNQVANTANRPTGEV